MRFELTHCCLRDSCSASWSYIAFLDLWSGREADDASANSTIPDSHRSAGMSHAPITCELNLVPKEGLKPSTSGL